MGEGGAVDLDPHKKLDRLYLNLVRYAGSVSGSQVHCTPFFTDYSIGIKFINKFLKSEAFAKEKKSLQMIYLFFWLLF